MHVRGMNFLALAQATTALRALTRKQMPPTNSLSHDFAARSDLEPLANGLLRFNTLRTTHKNPERSAKMRAQSKSEGSRGKGDFGFLPR